MREGIQVASTVMSTVPTCLYVTPFFPSPINWRGAYCLDFVKALARTQKFHVVVFKEGDGADYELESVTVHTFRAYRLPGNVFPMLFVRRNQRSFLAAVKRAGVDIQDVAVCHGHTANYGIYPLAMKSVNPHCQTILHHHDLQSFGLNNGILRHCWLYNMLMFPLLRWMHEKIDCHVFISEMVRKSFLSAPDTSWTDYAEYRKQMRGLPYRPTRIKDSCVLYNGVNTSVFNSNNQRIKQSNTFTIGCVGNFVALKEQLTLLRAVLKTGIVNCRVILIGSGPTQSECERFARENKMQVDFRPEVSHEQLADFYRSLDLFVLPSVFEGFGCVYTEAWACGTPFITTSEAGVAELIPPEDYHLWVAKPHDPDDLAEKIVYYYQNRLLQELNESVDIKVVVEGFLDEIVRFR